jgi:hypothetical protein
MREFFAQVTFEHTGHDPVDCTADSGQLLEHRSAVSALFEGALERV